MPSSFRSPLSSHLIKLWHVLYFIDLYSSHQLVIKKKKKTLALHLTVYMPIAPPPLSSSTPVLSDEDYIKLVQ